MLIFYLLFEAKVHKATGQKKTKAPNIQIRG